MARVLDLAQDVDPPVLGVERLILDAAERDAKHDIVSIVGKVPPGLVDEVRAQVGRRPAGLRVAGGEATADRHSLGDGAILLDPQRIDGEDQRLPRMNERGQEDLDVVVGVDLVAVCQFGVDAPMRLERADAEVDGPGRIPDEHFGRVLGRSAVDRCILGESGEYGGPLPDRCVERPVYGDCRIDPRDARGDLAVQTVVHDPVRQSIRARDRHRIDAGRRAVATRDGYGVDSHAATTRSRLDAAAITAAAPTTVTSTSNAIPGAHIVQISGKALVRIAGGARLDRREVLAQSCTTTGRIAARFSSESFRSLDVVVQIPHEVSLSGGSPRASTGSRAPGASPSARDRLPSRPHGS